jgi:plastocyanin
MRSRYIGSPLLAAALAGALLTGCGGGGDDNATASPGTSQATTSQSGGTPRPSSTNAVTIDNFAFSPATITVKPGTRVTVANHDSTAHTATSDDGSSFDTGDIDPGSSKTITLSKAGTFAYHCNIHPFMHGRIVVS